MIAADHAGGCNVLCSNDSHFLGDEAAVRAATYQQGYDDGGEHALIWLARLFITHEGSEAETLAVVRGFIRGYRLTHKDAP